MKNFIIVLAVSSILSLSACKGGESYTTADKAPSAAPISEAKLGAVLVYADWCGSCKILDPKIEAVKSAHDFKNTAFVTLDYTDKNSDAFFRSADKAGVTKAVQDYLGDKIKTGQLLLVDMDDQKVIGVIKKDMSNADIVATISKAAKGA